MKNEPRDEIVEEIRARRHAHAQSLDFDLSRIVADLQRQEQAAGMPTVTREPRRPEPSARRSSG